MEKVLKKIGTSTLRGPVKLARIPYSTRKSISKYAIKERPKHLIVYCPDIKGAGGVGIFSGTPGYSKEVKDWIWKFVEYHGFINSVYYFSLNRLKKGGYSKSNDELSVSANLYGDAAEIFHKSRNTGLEEPWWDENFLEVFAKYDTDYTNLELMKAMLKFA